MRAARFAFLGLAALTVPALAELTVIHDSGQTVPLEFAFHPPEAEPVLSQSPLPAFQGNPGAQLLAKLFPVHTPQLTPGPVPTRAVQLPPAQPLFLIGSDALSREWLQRYRAKLVQAQAIGLVVEVASLADYEALVQFAAPLPLSPVRGGNLAKQFGLQHYPVLLYNGRIEQ